MNVEVRGINRGKVSSEVDKRTIQISRMTAELQRKASEFLEGLADKCSSGEKTTSSERNLALMIKHCDLDDRALNEQINRLTDQLNNTNGIERKKIVNEISTLKLVVGLRNYRDRW